MASHAAALLLFHVLERLGYENFMPVWKGRETATLETSPPVKPLNGRRLISRKN